MAEYDFEQKPADIAKRIMTKKIKKAIIEGRQTVPGAVEAYMHCYHINEKHKAEITRLCYERLKD